MSRHNVVTVHVRKKSRSEGDVSVAEWSVTYRKSGGSNPSSHFPSFRIARMTTWYFPTLMNAFAWESRTVIGLRLIP